jgi:predicted membrane-bound spermidine synthase
MTRPLLFTLLFLTGGATLLLEVTATRMLAPYFGNSITVLSSVLAVVLGFLSLGYWLGGMRAERGDASLLLFGATTAAGGSGFLVSLLMAAVMPVLGLTLPLTWGPLVASVLLFALPSTFLGMVAPAAVRLHPLVLASPGRASGEVLAVSTVGSIAGSLIGGFLLVPIVGLRWTILGTAIVLTVTGLVGLSRGRARPAAGIAAGLFIIAVPSLFVPWTWFLKDALVATEETAYQHAVVLDLPSADIPGRTTRYLVADYAFMSGEDRDTGEPVFPYVLATLALIDALPQRPTSVAVLGGGAFTIPRMLHNRYPEARIDAVEIDGALERLARRIFRLAPGGTLRTVATDGRRFLRDTDARYDVIVLDMYQSLSIPPHTLTEEFFRLASERLTPNGIIIANIIGVPSGRGPSLPLAAAKTAASALPHQTLLVMPATGPVKNFLLLLSRGDHPLHTNRPPTLAATVPLAPDRLVETPVFRDEQANTVRYEITHAALLR